MSPPVSWRSRSEEYPLFSHDLGRLSAMAFPSHQGSSVPGSRPRPTRIVISPSLRQYHADQSVSQKKKVKPEHSGSDWQLHISPYRQGVTHSVFQPAQAHFSLFSGRMFAKSLSELSPEMGAGPVRRVHQVKIHPTSAMRRAVTRRLHGLVGLARSGPKGCEAGCGARRALSRLPPRRWCSRLRSSRG